MKTLLVYFGLLTGVLLAALPGDFNRDGIVNMDDLPVWLAEEPEADANGDGVVDNADLVTWAQNYGATEDSQPHPEMIPTHVEVIPNYAFAPDTRTVSDGDWHDDGIWSNGIPTESSDAWINHSVTLDGEAAAEDILIDGRLSFGRDTSSSLAVGTLIVFGTLQAGTADAEVTGSVEIVFRDTPFDFDFDPQQLGHGLIVMPGGTLETNGRDNTAFLEVFEAPKGSDQLVLESVPEGWEVGDELYLPPRSGDRAHIERVTIAAIDEAVITLTEPMAQSHTPEADKEIHAAHLSGNVVFRSENPEGVRGNVIATGDSVIRVTDAVFADLGRTRAEVRLDNTHLGEQREPLHIGTNQVGRYSFHLHHVTTQPEFSGNVIRDGEKWGLAIHNTHYGQFTDNVVVGMTGAGIIFEDGNEYGNTVADNFVGDVKGSGAGTQSRVGQSADPLGPVPGGELPATHDPGTLYGDGTPENPYRTLGDLGHEGAGIWARGAANDITGNVVADAAFGHVLWGRFQDVEQGPDGITFGNGSQEGFDYAHNRVYNVLDGYLWFGLARENGATDFVSRDNDVWNAERFALDVAYSGGTLSIFDSDLQAGIQTVQETFSGRIVMQNCNLDSGRVGISANAALFEIADTTIRYGRAGIGYKIEPLLENVTFVGRAGFESVER